MFFFLNYYFLFIIYYVVHLGAAMKCWRLLCGSAVSVGAAAEPGVLASVGREHP